MSYTLNNTFKKLDAEAQRNMSELYQNFGVVGSEGEGHFLELISTTASVKTEFTRQKCTLNEDLADFYRCLWPRRRRNPDYPIRRKRTKFKKGGSDYQTTTRQWSRIKISNWRDLCWKRRKFWACRDKRRLWFPPCWSSSIRCWWSRQRCCRRVPCEGRLLGSAGFAGRPATIHHHHHHHCEEIGSPINHEPIWPRFR